MNDDKMIWLGSKEAFDVYKALMDRMMAMTAGPWSEDEQRQEGHPLVQIYGNVATIRVQGTLINGSAGWMLRYGVTGYDDIREAAIYALKEASVGSILLVVNSPGGHAEGPNDLAKTLKRIDKVKPIVTYVDTKMYSAALWIGVAGRKSFIAETGGAGSLGVVMIHKEYSKQLKDEGVTVKVVRAGSEKMLANPYEPLSDKALSNLEAQAQEMYDIFLASVAENRGLATTVADKKFGQGREFMGQKAVDAGLIDAVGTYEDAFSHAQKLAESRMKKTEGAASTPKVSYGQHATNATNVVQLSSNGVQILAGSEHNAPSCQGTAMPQPLTDIDIAAAVAGVTLVAGDATAATPSNPTAAASSATPAVTATQEAPAAAASTAPATPAAAPAPLSLDAAMAPVLASLTASQAEVGRLSTQVAAMTAQAEKVKPQIDGLLAIARKSLTAMGLHFGLNAEAVNGMAPEMVLSEHARITGLFQEKFKAGGVAATVADNGTKQTEASAPHDFFDLVTQKAAK